MSLYTDEVRRIVKTIKAPSRHFIYDVIEYPRWLTLRMYRDNFELLPEDMRVSTAMWMQEQLKRVNATGIPCYLEIFESVPNRRIH